MVYRYTGIAAVAVLAFAFTLLNGLLRPTVEGPPWQFVVLAGLALGAVITWTGMTYRMRSWIVAAINLLALAIVSFRIAAPETLVFLFPTGDTLGAFDAQLTQAMRLIRTGIEPVIPVSGLVVIVTAVFWAVGAVTAYGLLKGKPALAVVPGLVLILQFATMDRSPTNAFHILIFIVLLAAAILAVTWDERANTAGRMAHASGQRPNRNLLGRATAAALVVTLVGTVVAVGAFSGQVPYDGVVTWRASTGLTGDFYGSGVSYNPFVSIQQSLVTNSNTPLFFANIEGEVAPDRVYFRLLTLETYEGGKFFADRPEVEPLEAEVWEEEGQAFAGPTASITTSIVIDRLDTEWLPAAYSPVAVATPDDTLYKSMRVRKEDGSLILDGGRSYQGLGYSVASVVPLADLDALASDEGGLSPLFQAAADNEENVPTVREVDLRTEPPNVERYLQLPEDLDEGIAALAREKTAGLETPFEIGLALESWFRSSDFKYTTDIPAGHGASDLAMWLLEENSDSPFHRAGYCENFATSMAVMARTLGVPSRAVLGFTPGQQVSPPVDDSGQPVNQDGGEWVVVRDRNAHAWVELWMPSQGWVRFDPTPRPDQVNPTTAGDVTEVLGFELLEYFDDIPEPALSALGDADSRLIDPRLGEEEDLDPLNIPELVDQPGGVGGLLPAWLATALLAVAAVVVMAGAIPLVKLWRRRRRMARLRNGDITAAWEDIVARLEDYGDAPAPTLTPSELAHDVDPAMEPLATAYARAVYGPSGSIDESHVSSATTSLQQTAVRLAGRYSLPQRIVAWYRPASLIPQRWRRYTRRGRAAGGDPDGLV